MNPDKCIMCNIVKGTHLENGLLYCKPCYDVALSRFLDMAKTKGVEFEEPSKILENLYLGSEGSAIDKEYLIENNFTAIIVAFQNFQI